MKNKYLALLLGITLLVSLISTAVVAATEDEETLQEETEESAEETTETSSTEEVEESAERGSIVGRALVESYANTMRQQPADNTSIAEEFSLIAENDKLALYAVTNAESQRLGEINLLDKISGYVYRSNPELKTDPIASAAGQAIYRTQSQLILTYTKGYNKVDLNSAFASVNQGLTTVVQGDGFVRFVYRFANLDRKSVV